MPRDILIPDCLNRPIPYLAEPTVGERREKLGEEVELLGDVDHILDRYASGLPGKGCVVHFLDSLREAVIDLQTKVR